MKLTTLGEIEFQIWRFQQKQHLVDAWLWGKDLGNKMICLDWGLQWSSHICQSTGLNQGCFGVAQVEWQPCTAFINTLMVVFAPCATNCINPVEELQWSTYVSRDFDVCLSQDFYRLRNMKLFKDYLRSC